VAGTIDFSILMLDVSSNYFVVRWRRAKNAPKNVDAKGTIANAFMNLEIGLIFVKKISLPRISCGYQ
jgi:hypothetical protein